MVSDVVEKQLNRCEWWSLALWARVVAVYRRLGTWGKNDIHPSA